MENKGEIFMKKKQIITKIISVGLAAGSFVNICVPRTTFPKAPDPI